MRFAADIQPTPFATQGGWRWTKCHGTSNDRSILGWKSGGTVIGGVPAANRLASCHTICRFSFLMGAIELHME